MGKLVFGKNGQVQFRNESEKQEAFNYMRESANVKLVHEDNQDQKASLNETHQDPFHRNTTSQE